MRGDTDHLAALVAKVQRWLVCKRWRKAIYGAICVQKCECVEREGVEFAGASVCGIVEREFVGLRSIGVQCGE